MITIKKIFLVSTQHKGNEIRLYKAINKFPYKASYYVKWGPIGNCTSRLDIRTKTGRTPTFNSVMKQFNEVVKAMKLVNFTQVG